ncbi:MAG: hypothetical protein HZA52_17090 [Planctomycetes bacterium]|nr:hypothetical protein [Planctomycetota bacterium]
MKYRTKRSLLLLALGACVAASLLWWRRSGGEQVSGTRESRGSQSTQVSAVDPTTASSAALAPTDSSSSERSHAEPRLQVRAVDTSGRPIDGAEVTYTAIPDLLPAGRWIDVDWEALDAATARERTGDDGRASVRIDRAPSDERAFALHVTKPGFRADSRALTFLSANSGELLVTLRSERASLSVIDASGAPIGEFAVELCGDVAVRARSAHAPDDVAARRVLHRKFLGRGTTDAIPATDDEVALRITTPSGLAALRVGRLDGEIVVHVFPSFELSGRVVSTSGDAVAPGTQVWVGPADAFSRDWVAELAVRADASFGPVLCPILPSRQYAFHLLSAEVLPVYVVRETPEPLERVFVEFQAVEGLPVDVHVRNAEGAAVAGAAVGLAWPGSASLRDVFGLAKLTDVDGHAHLLAPIEAEITARSKRSGHAPAESPPQYLGPDSERRIGLTLVPGGRIEGRVTFQGRPVESFQVVHWPERDPSATQMRDFEGREDGRFVVEDVPLEPLLLYAADSEHPRSEIVSLAFRDGCAGPVELELAAAVRATGSVIDADTRRPLHGARVQCWNAWDYKILSPQGEPAVADAEGRFEVAGLRRGLNMLWVEANGYHWAQPSVDVGEEHEIDLGVVPLEKGAPLTVQLVADHAIEFSRFLLEASISVEFPQTPFPSDGVLTLDDCARGRVLLGIGYPDGSLAYSLHEFVRAAPQRVVHAVPTDRAIELSVEVPQGCDLVGPIFVGLGYEDGERWITRWKDTGDVGRVRFEGVPIGAVIARLYANGAEWGAIPIRLDGSDEQRIEVLAVCRRKSLRFVDHDGKPRAGCTVVYSCAGTSVRFRIEGFTDASGVLELAWPECPELLVSLVGAHSRLGMTIAIDEQSTQTVRLAPPAELRVCLRDREVELSGITIWIDEPTSEQTLNPASTSKAGCVVWTDIAPTTYRVIVEGQGVWRTTALLDARDASAPPHVLDVRRTVDARVRALGPLGEPVEGAHVALASQEFACTTDTWIAEGRLGALVPFTDANGRARFDGLPNGDYQCVVVAPDGRTASLELTLVAGVQQEFDVRFVE